MPSTSPSPSASSSRWTSQEIALAVGALVLITVVAFEGLAATTIMPTVVAALDADSWYPIASGAALATQLSATVIAGALADWRGPRIVLLGGLGLFVAGLIICALSPSIWVFIAGRLLQGFGGGLLIVPLYVLVGSVASPAHRPTFFAMFSLAWVLPSLIGPAIAGQMTRAWGWESVFGAVPILAFIALLPLALVLRRVGTGSGELPSRLSSLALMACGGGAGVVLIQLAGALSTTWATVACFSTGAAVCIWLLPRLLPRGTFRARRGMPSAILARMSAMGSEAGLAVMIPLVLQRVHGWSESSAAWWVTIGSVTWSLGSIAQARVRSPQRRRTLPFIGAIMLATGSLILLTALTALPTWVPLIGWMLAGLGVGLVHSPLSVLALEVTPQEKHGRVSSWLQVADAAGPAVELAFVSVFMSAWGLLGLSGGAAFAPYWVVGVALAVVSVLAARRIADR